MLDVPSLTRRGFVAGTAVLSLVRPVFAQVPTSPFKLTAEMAEVPLGDAVLPAPVFNQSAAGPLLEMRRGESFALELRNALTAPLTFGAQGLRGAAVDGGSEPIAPGETRTITLTPPDAGTFVYRAQADEDAGSFLSGPLLVTDDEPKLADRDVVMALNMLVVAGADVAAEPQRVVTINGEPELPLKARPGERLRLRVANLSQDSLGGLRLPESSQIVALDGQPCEPFPPLEGTLLLAPLGRADVVLDVPASAPTPLTIRDAFEDIVLATVKLEGEPVVAGSWPPRLPANARLPDEIPFQNAVRATWKAGTAPSGPLVRATAGSSVIVTFENDGNLRALALQGHAARHLDALDDGWKPWWQDTFIVQADETLRFAFRAEAPGRYALDMIPLQGEDRRTSAVIEITA